jgi:hypothetical protein
MIVCRKRPGHIRPCKLKGSVTRAATRHCRLCLGQRDLHDRRRLQSADLRRGIGQKNLGTGLQHPAQLERCRNRRLHAPSGEPAQYGRTQRKTGTNAGKASPEFPKSHLFDDQRQQILRQKTGPQGHFPVLFLRRQNRRAGAERRREKHLAENHGRRGQASSTEKPFFPKGYTVGYLEQEPLVDVDQNRTGGRGGRRSGNRGPAQGIRGSTSSLPNPWSDDEMDKLIQRQGEVQEKLDALDAWDLDARLEMAMDALRCPPGDTPVNVLSGGERRRVALCRLLLQESRTFCCWTNPPTTWMPKAWPGWNSTCSSMPARSLPSPTTAIFWTMWPAGFWNWTGATAFPGRATTLPGWSRSRNACAKEKNPKAPAKKPWQRELEWIRMSPKGAPCQEPGAHQRLRKAAGPGERKPAKGSGTLHSPRSAPGRRGH